MSRSDDSDHGGADIRRPLSSTPQVTNTAPSQPSQPPHGAPLPSTPAPIELAPSQTPSATSHQPQTATRTSQFETLIPVDDAPGSLVRSPTTDPQNDKFWAVDGAFSEAGFAGNFRAPRKFVDVIWTVAFYVNCVLSFILFLSARPWASADFGESADGLSYKDMLIIGIISIGIAAGICVVTYFIIWHWPRAYIKGAMIIGVVLLLAALLALSVLFSALVLLLGILVFIAGFIFWIGVRGKLDFSADVLQCSAVILRKFPTILWFNTAMFLLQSGFSYLFECGTVLVFARGISFWAYIYAILSYFWIQSTLNFVTYQTCAGVAAAWYFLNGTEYMPEHPIYFSLFHTLTSGFGPVALAGLLEGIGEAFEWFEENGEKLSCGLTCVCFTCVKCMAKCCLRISDWVLSAVSRYSLIYCAMFGVSAAEGVKRWDAVSKKKAVDMIVNHTIIDRTFRFYSYCVGALAGGIGGLIACEIWHKGSVEFGFMFAFSTLCAASGLFLVGNPMKVISDTLFVGFAEAPLRLEAGASEIYGLFKGKAKDLIDEEIDRAKNPEKYARGRSWWSWLCFCC
jgi:hypothetical protein